MEKDAELVNSLNRIEQPIQQLGQQITAGKSFYAPFKLRYEEGAKENDQQAFIKYFYFDCLSIKVSLDMKPDTRPLYVELLSSWTGVTFGDITKWMNEAANGENLIDSLFKIAERDKENAALKNCVKCLSEFVKYGYNRRIDIDDEELKISADKPECSLLAFAIVCTTLLEHFNMDPQQIDRGRMGVLYDYMQIASKVGGYYKSPNRKERRQIKKARKLNLFLAHEEVVYNTIRLWYEARVIYDTLARAASENRLEANDLSKIISESGMDIATGYRKPEDFFFS